MSTAGGRPACVHDAPAGEPSPKRQKSSDSGSHTATVERLAATARPHLLRKVFISHTAQDQTGRDFAASVLQPALKQLGLQVVIDYDYLQPGVDFSRELVDAAANCQVFVAVLSKSYVRRFWCMLELDLALNAQRLRHQQRHQQQGQPPGCEEQQQQQQQGQLPRHEEQQQQGQLLGREEQQQQEQEHQQQEQQQQQQQQQGVEDMPQPERDAKCQRPWVIPVFVDDAKGILAPQAIRELWQCAAAPLRHAGEALGVDLGRRAEWVDGGRWAANVELMLKLQFLTLDGSGGKDALYQLARKAVRAAVRRMPPLVDEGEAVGLEGRATALLVEMCGRLGVWLHGAGGLGKTTLAKRLRNRLVANGAFDCVAWVDVQHDDKDDTAKLAAHLKKALQRLTGNRPSGTTAAELAQELKDAVVVRKVLYVLDNVWMSKQLEHLLPTRWGEGSVVIITSREQRLNTAALFKMEARLLFHEVQLLDPDDSQALFRSCAGLPHGPPAGRLQEVEQQLLRSCNGLPLALEVVGGSLRDCEAVEYWESVLEALRRGNPVGDTGGLSEVLATSLRGLPPASVGMFLDAATILRGHPTADVLPVWEAWHGGGARSWLKDLQRRHLLSTDEEGRLAMHDVVVGLGRGMVLDGGSAHHGSRLWVEGGLVMGVSQERTRGCRVLAAHFSKLDDSARAALDEWHADLDWSAVRILFAGRTPVPVTASLLWLRAATWQQLLHVDATDRTVLDAAAQLRVLHVENCRELRALPESLWLMRSLRQLRLCRCFRLTAVADQVSKLARLQVLELHDSEQLEALPAALGQLSSLQHLDVNGSRCLVALPTALSRLTALTLLGFKHSSQLAVVPEGIARLGKLRQLDLSWCTQLPTMPDSLVQLAGLRHLNLGFCSLPRIPDCIGRLTALQELDLSSCNLVELPGSVTQLVSLRHLDLHYCSHLTVLPYALGQLSALQALLLSSCPLTSLPDSLSHLGNLTFLGLANCTQLVALPNGLAQLTALRRLSMSWCSKLPPLSPSIWRLPCLQRLEAEGCRIMPTLDVAPCSSPLQHLSLSSCTMLEAFASSFGQLTLLQNLVLRSCRLRGLPDSFGHLVLLHRLDLNDCSALRSLPDSLGELVLLRELDLGGCQLLARLPDSLGDLTALLSLDICDCLQLEAMPAAVGRLTSLRQLQARRCIRLAALPESLGELGLLQQLDLASCSRLAALPGSLSQLSQLQALSLSRCSELAALPSSMGDLQSLRSLSCDECCRLAGLPDSLGDLPQLGSLSLHGCIALERLPDSLSRLTSLEVLNLGGCSRLHALPAGLQQLSSLTRLVLDDCHTLQALQPVLQPQKTPC